MPLPPRRARRKHRLRVPYCSECHYCPSNNPCKPRSNHNSANSKHNYHPPPHHNPLVRSKSAVVRSLCKRMRAPFTRSHTVDESVLRYYSPETSEYTVSEGYLLKPESLSQSSRKGRRIPEIYVEDCLSVNFNKRLIEKFRARHRRYGDIKVTSSTTSPPPYEPLHHHSSATATTSMSRHQPFAISHRRSRSWQERSTRGRVGSASLLRGDSVSADRKGLLYSWTPSSAVSSSSTTAPRLDHPTTHQSSMRRSFLSSKARSFDYNVACHNDNDDFAAATTTRSRGHYGQGLLSRRSRSFEYESVSANIFSDDSLQTAREKIKKNMQLSDEGYGDRIPALDDRSKSYYDSNGDAKIRRDMKKKKARQKDLQVLLVGDEIEDELYSSEPPPRLMYGYDSELSCGETEIYLPSEYDPRREDTSKRKYTEFLSNTHEPPWLKSPEKRSKATTASGRGLDNAGYDGLADANEHIYCSIDEVSGQYRAPDYKRELEELSRWRRASSMEPHVGGVALDDTDLAVYGRRTTAAGLPSRRRTKSNDSYLNTDYAVYDNWSNVIEDEGYDDTADRYYDYEQQQRKPYENYDRQSTVRYGEYVEDSRLRQQRTVTGSGREARIASEPYYENVPYIWDRGDRSVPSYEQQRDTRLTARLARTESTPILYSDEDYGLDSYQDRRSQRRRRNISCPETRELHDRYTMDDGRGGRRGYYDEDRISHVLQSDDEFGSAETVIDRRGYHASRRDDYYGVDSRASGKAYPQAHNRDEDEEIVSTRHRSRRKTSCPDCREEMLEMERARQRRHERQDELDPRYRYKRRNSSCPEAREIETLDHPEDRRRYQEEYRTQAEPQQQQQQAPIKRNVAISDTLEYYEYSMESESQCSENCGFGPFDPRRPHERAPRPGNANSNLFDSQIATSDTANYPRTTTTTTTTTTTYDDHDHHNYHHYHHHYQRDYPTPATATAARSAQLTRRPCATPMNAYDDGDYENTGNAVYARGVDDDVYDDDPSRRRSRPDRPTRLMRTPDDDDQTNNRRSSSMPECSDYASHSSSYEKPGRYHPGIDDAEHHHRHRNGSVKRGQFTRSFSNADAPTDEKVGESNLH